MSNSANSMVLIKNGTNQGTMIWPGGRGAFYVTSGTIGGATAALQASFDGGTTWQNVDRSGDTYVTFTALPGAGEFNLPLCQIRANVTGGSPSGLNAGVSTIVAA